MSEATHPIQPLQMEDKVLRFKRNSIVEFLLLQYKPGLNDLATRMFDEGDWTQFYQLIGYSHSGIPNCPEEVWQAAISMYKRGESEDAARVRFLRDELSAVKKGMRKSVARLYGIHPDDLDDKP